MLKGIYIMLRRIWLRKLFEEEIRNLKLEISKIDCII
jgi:hypothetical protein